MAFQRPFLIILKRDEASQPWGFRVSGGADLAAPPRVDKVTEGSPAALHGMHDGDLIIQLGKHNVQDLSEARVNALLAQPAKRLEVFIVREDFLQKPRKGEPSTVKAVVHNQYNSPLQLYSQEKVAETLAYHAQAITAEDGVNNIQPVGLPQNLVRSAVLQALSEDEIGVNPYRTSNGATVVQRATAPPPPPPKPRPPSYSSGSPQSERPYSSSGHHVTFASPGTPGTPPVQQPNFYVPPPPAPPPQSSYQQPSYQQPSYEPPSYQPPGNQQASYQQPASYQTQYARQVSYEETDRRQQQIQEAELRQRKYEEERQKQAQYEEGRFRQPPQDFRRAEYEAEQRRLREEEERLRRLAHDEEGSRRLQQHHQQHHQEDQQRQRRVELEEQERRRRQEQQEYEQYQQHQQQYQRYLEEQKRKDDELRRRSAEQQQQEAARRSQLEEQKRRAQQQQQQPQQRFQNVQREPLNVQRAQQEAQERRYQPSTAVASSPLHQEQVGSQAQRWESRICEEQQSRMPGTPLGSPTVSRRARDNVWPPKESSVRWTPKTGFSPQLTRQSSQNPKQFVWPPPKSDLANGDDGGFPSRPPSRTALNAWHPGSPTSGTRTPPFARSPSLGRRTRDVAWPPPQSEGSPKFVPRPSSRTGLHLPDEFIHQNASCGVPATYRPPPNSSQYL